MPIRKYKPTSPGRRDMTVSTFEEITKKRPEKTLIEPLKRKAGRNNQGRITVRHQGGGASAIIARSISSATSSAFRLGWRPSNTIRTVRPDRTALSIATARSATCSRRNGLKVGDTFSLGAGSPIRRRQRAATGRHPGRHADPQHRALPGRGGQMVRSAGVSAQLMAKQDDYAQIRMPSGEVRLVRSGMHGDARPGRQCRSRERAYR